MKKLGLLVMVLAAVTFLGASVYAAGGPTLAVKGTITSANNKDFTLKKEGTTIEMNFKGSELKKKNTPKGKVGKTVTIKYYESPAGLFATDIDLVTNSVASTAPVTTTTPTTSNASTAASVKRGNYI